MSRVHGDAVAAGRWLAVLAVLLTYGGGGGCQQPFVPVHDGKYHAVEMRSGRSRAAGVVADIHDHVIVVDGQGVPHDPGRAGGCALSPAQFRCQLKRMFLAMEAFHKLHPDRRVLIFVHGGLNKPVDALRSADYELEEVMDAGIYPIYLNWNSDLGDTYLEHAEYLTQGQRDPEDKLRPFLAPLYLFADLGRAVTRAPIVWVNQVGTDTSATAADLRALLAGGGAAATAAAATSQPSADESFADDIAAAAERRTNGRKGARVDEFFRALRELQDAEGPVPPGTPRRQMRVYIGPDLDVNARHLAALGAMYVVTSPTKFGLSWLIDGLGSPAWENMSRRTQMAFDGQLGGTAGLPAPAATTAQVTAVANASGARTAQQRERATARASAERVLPSQRKARQADWQTTGAFAVFREELIKALSRGGPGSSRPYRVTLVGHSMGTIVLNEWLRRDVIDEMQREVEQGHGRVEVPTGPQPIQYEQIVYMAAACTVREFQRSVVPYLLQHGPRTDATDAAARVGTQFYNLTLHPVADLREVDYYDLPPRGSLLVWLDDFLTAPRTPLDRTLGRWDNIITAWRVIPEAALGQVTIKAFALAPTGDRRESGKYYGPQAHGDFRQAPYWNPAFWYGETPEVPSVDAQSR